MESNQNNKKKKMVTLKCCDGTTLEVEEAAAFVSPVIKNYIINNNDNNTFVVPNNITGPIFSKVIEYCRRHVNDNYDNDLDYNDSYNNIYDNDEDLKSWDDEFVKNMDPPTIYRLSNAAAELEICNLGFLASEAECHTIQTMIPDGKITAQEIRRIFNISERDAKITTTTDLWDDSDHDTD